MQVTVTVAAPEGSVRNVEITSAEPLSAAELAGQLGALLDVEQQSLSSAGRPMPGDALLGGPGLRNGARLALGPAGPRTNLLSSVLEARVVSGPDCGLRVPLARGIHIIGRGRDADVVIADQDMSRRHAELSVTNAGVQVRDLGSTNGTGIDGVALDADGARLELGQLLQLGATTVTLVSATEPPAAVRASSDGAVVVNRGPRLARPEQDEVIQFPAPADASRRAPTQWLASLLPAALGIGLAAALGNIEFLAFALLSPASLLAGALSDRRAARRSQRRANAQFLAAEQRAAATLASRLAQETAQRRRAHPDAAAVGHIAALPDCRLWERRPGDADFLTVRVGSADQPARVRTARAGAPLPDCVVSGVPVVAELSRGAVGVAGPLPYARGLARWIVGQLLALHSPNDLSLMAILDDDAPDWQWLRWRAVAVATSAAERVELLDSVSALIAARLGQRGQSDRWHGPWTVILIDPAQLVAGLSGLRSLLRDGPRVGVTAVCVAAHSRLLPQHCHAVARFDSAIGERIDFLAAAEAAIAGAVSERVCVEWADQLARDLAPLRDADVDGAGAIATESRLLDVLGLNEVSDDALLRRWRTSGRPITALGVTASGPQMIDLVRDGPHGLIAGSTGSGKSELLRSLVAGLAANNSPVDLAFVLIDYKGGAAFAECAELPHTIAMITDLDSHLTRRALISLDAELRRRESLFAVAGVGDLDAYRNGAHHVAAPLPRLVLVVDEFAALAEELPDFISGLVAIAQRGRSLGLHLLLATQRPTGVVSPEIKANMALRIALRVTDSAESADVVGTGDAAAIDKNRPGRALARVADGLVEFQTARVDVALTPAHGPELRLLDEWNRRRTADSDEAGVKPDLHLLVDAAREAARRSGARPPDPVWLPPLAAQVPAANCRGAETEPHRVCFGLADRPELQRQTPLSHDLAAGGSLAFIGSSRSGRTSALRTMASLAASQLRPGDLQLYVIDCAGGSLCGLGQLPSCATALSAADPGSVARLIALLAAELTTRLARLARAASGDACDARSRGMSMPAVLIVLDGWEGFTALSDSFDAGNTAELLLRVIRDGPSAGFTVVLGGDRSLLGVRTSAAIERKFLLRLTEPSDYASAGISMKAAPSRMPAGRVIAVEDGAEAQLAILGADASSSAQWAAVAAIAQEQLAARQRGQTGLGMQEPGMSESDAMAAPIRIEPLPDRVDLSELAPVRASFAPGEKRIILGRGGDDASPIIVDLLQEQTRFLIAGQARSGRSTAARLIASQAHDAGAAVLVAAANASPLAQWARKRDVAVLSPSAIGPIDGSWAELLVIDDSEAFADTDAGMWLLDMMASTAVPVVACARPEDLLTSFRGIAVTVRRSRTGLLLQPSAIDGELLGIRIPPARLAAPPGRGLLMTDDVRADRPAGLPVQIATSS